MNMHMYYGGIIIDSSRLWFPEWIIVLMTQNKKVNRHEIFTVWFYFDCEKWNNMQPIEPNYKLFESAFLRL